MPFSSNLPFLLSSASLGTCPGQGLLELQTYALEHNEMLQKIKITKVTLRERGAIWGLELENN